MMSVFLLLATVVGVPGDAIANDKPDAVVAVTSTESQSLFDVNKEMRHWLRAEAVAKERRDWEASVVKLVTLYGKITRDPRLESSETLESYRVKLRSRLRKIHKQLERETARKGTTPQEPLDRRASVASAKSASLSSPPGPSQSTSKTAARGGAAVDAGSALIELIERTISPDFWDVNGGPGSIVYYQQWHALVVRATPDIHRLIGGEVFGRR